MVDYRPSLGELYAAALLAELDRERVPPLVLNIVRR